MLVCLKDNPPLRITEIKILRYAGDVTVDKVRNEYIRGMFKLNEIKRKMRENRLRCYRHVIRRKEDHMTRIVMAIEEGNRNKGMPTDYLDEHRHKGHLDNEPNDWNDAKSTRIAKKYLKC
ncbi:hypothetical protein EVAR_103765_1 [Eumeta japonica]|uniref:Uncharacterized protein n=1 Tax=Eumeta variegata TaxID=151549 RepID=A0A4C2A2Q2_EUMVA|nr:hypothetical protein EVAR_103765_1 [Eumeta japonica]